MNDTPDDPNERTDDRSPEDERTGDDSSGRADSNDESREDERGRDERSGNGSSADPRGRDERSGNGSSADPRGRDEQSGEESEDDSPGRESGDEQPESESRADDESREESSGSDESREESPGGEEDRGDDSSKRDNSREDTSTNEDDTAESRDDLPASGSDGTESTGPERASEPSATAVGSASSVPSTWKVLGELDNPGATGVLGRNVATTGGGYGVSGTTASSNTDSAGVFAEAPNGNADGLYAQSRNGGSGVYATTDAINHYGVWGVNFAGDGAFSSGVLGETYSDRTGAAAVRGNTRGTAAAEVYGVRGDTSKEGTVTTNPAGVYGFASATTGRTWGVRGKSASTKSDSAGVRAEAKGGNGLWASSDDSYGVYARSTNDYGGYFGTGAPDKPGVYGANLNTDPQRGRGVMGFTRTTGTNTAGVYGRAEASSGRTYGVHGTSKSVGTGSSGVYGDAQANSGQTYGVHGRTYSDDPEAAGVHGVGTTAAPAVHAAGHVAVDRVGLSAYRSTNQTISGDGANTTVVFNAVYGNRDDFNGYDTTTGVYTVQVPGDYHVDACLDYADTFAEGARINYNLWVNGTASRGLGIDVVASTTSYRAVESFSKLLVDLVPGDTISIVTSQSSGVDKALFGDAGGQTYMTIHKVG